MKRHLAHLIAFAWLMAASASLFASTAYAHGHGSIDSFASVFATVVQVSTILAFVLVKGPFRAKMQVLAAYVLVTVASLAIIKLFESGDSLARFGAMVYAGGLLLGPIIGYAWIAAHR